MIDLYTRCHWYLGFCMSVAHIYEWFQGSRFIQILSSSAIRLLILQTAYVATKHAVSMVLEVLKKSIIKITHAAKTTCKTWIACF